jgi:hypothetical protein
LLEWRGVPLEAEVTAGGIEEVELLHAVARDRWLCHVDALSAHVPVSAVDVCATELQADGAMREAARFMRTGAANVDPTASLPSI